MKQGIEKKIMAPVVAPVVARAHGRVNLIGEHTDYNGGWVLPTLIPQFTEVTLSHGNSHDADHRQVRASSAIPGQNGVISLETFELGQERKTDTWIDYIQGATFTLREHFFKIKGFDLQITSTVPAGSGLSSSAALEIALLRAIRTAFQLQYGDIEMAQFGQEVENKFVGANVGILDQMACALGQFGFALFLDTFKMTYELIPLPLNKFDLVIINSGVVHSHASGDYNQRRSECEAACAKLGIKHLRDFTPADLPKLSILEPTLARRAKHVITENERVHQAVDALRKNDLKLLGQLFYESHASMRDDYAVSVPAVDHLVEFCRAQKGVFGARLTGGGFGGSIVALTEKGLGREIAERVVAEYDKTSQIKGSILTA